MAAPPAVEDDGELGRPTPRRLIVAMAGASGARYTLGLLAALRDLRIESHLVTCACSRSIVRAETGLTPKLLRSRAYGWYHERNQAAAISSGSFLTLGMVIVPCTSRSLAALVTGVADNLVQRAADVTMKEGRRLVVAMAERETSPIGLENLDRAEQAGIRVIQLEGSPTAQRVRSVTNELLGCFGIEPVEPISALEARP